MTQRIEIGNRAIGPDAPAYVIAEAGVNHNGSIQIAKELVDIAADSEADAVKFQKRKLKNTYVEDIVEDPAIAEMGVEYTVSNLKDVLLTDEQYREVAEYCDKQGIQFLCSPWDVDSVDYLEGIDIPLYKVGSPDMTNFVLLERLLETGKPLLLSTGMSEEKEIERTVEFLQERNADFGLLHCRSTYPSPFHNLNLDFMNELKRRYNVPVGYSGHERGIAVSGAAVAMGASVIERHFTLSRDMEGPDHSASLEPQGLKKLVRDIRNIEESQGVPRRYMTRGEYNNRVSLSKSLASTDKIREGEQINRKDLTAKSPAKGISPQELYTVVGKRAQRNIASDQLLQWDDIQNVDEKEFDTDLENWGIVVRFSDISEHDWGNPDAFEFRINGADLEQEFKINQYDKQLGIHAPEQKGHDIVDLSARDETRRAEAVDLIQRVIDRVRDDIKPYFETQDPPIVIHPGGITEHDMNLEAIPEMNNALEQSMSELDDDGVQLLLENMPPLPWIYGGQQYHNNFMNAEEIAEYCERTGQKICYDTSHAKLWCNYADVDLYEHAKTLRPYTEYLHVADAIGVDGEGIQIGDGEIDFERLMDLYQDFDGPIITEIWRGHERKGRGFKEAAETLSEYF
ncbi:N-acetylneuraminate synthase [Halorubrum ezzemoulense]|uniref:N-acetylneuraminate synthase n=1 Tax=Halorubrum ezzemoulense TaxID=337243 RepID=A0A256JMI5_HALEZ|nr:N-acetylneuraminate synthase family protein [Halorubrum ezzemoulense]OYR69602.1 N-acetylneuraminate synthase [Halorubrum ezzemoulense]